MHRLLRRVAHSFTSQATLQPRSLPKRLRVFRSTTNDPWFNLATEEWIFHNHDPKDCQILFLWRNSPTVVIGRNQNPWKECHIQRMDEDGVLLARRKSGGGAVFQDLGNSCFTFLSPIDGYSSAVNSQVLLNALEILGIHGMASGRNDLVLTADLRKFSGSAFRLTTDRAFHHGTLLVGVDMAALGRYLNPSKAKLESKGVKSVQARVVNLSAVLPSLNQDILDDHIIYSFCKMYGFHPDAVTAEVLDHRTLSSIETLTDYYSKFKDWNWRFGQTPEFNHSMETRFPWGSVEVHLNSNEGVITGTRIFSDCLFPNFIEKLESVLSSRTSNGHGPAGTSLPYNQQGIRQACALVRQSLEQDPDRQLLIASLQDFEDWLAASI